ncbi:MAG: DUF4145 domain-containing protein [Phycisphaerales bacterium]|nr:DUF4145 domain-containing protein [Phycisphaerales bacterium]
MSTEQGSNFEFMNRYDNRVSHLGSQAEQYVHTDPESCLFKLRLMVEMMARRLVELQAPRLADLDLIAILRSLEQYGMLPKKQADGMHAIRRDGNAAVHGSETPVPTAMRRLRDAHRISAWYCSMIQRGAKVRTGQFVPPPGPASANEHSQAMHEAAEALEDHIDDRRQATREGLLLFAEQEELPIEVQRIVSELEGLDRVAQAAGEPLVDAEFVAVVMAMEMEQLLEHPTLGLDTREAKREAEKQFQRIKEGFELREAMYAEERRALMLYHQRERQGRHTRGD